MLLRVQTPGSDRAIVVIHAVDSVVELTYRGVEPRLLDARVRRANPGERTPERREGSGGGADGRARRRIGGNEGRHRISSFEASRALIPDKPCSLPQMCAAPHRNSRRTAER